MGVGKCMPMMGQVPMGPSTAPVANRQARHVAANEAVLSLVRALDRLDGVLVSLGVTGQDPQKAPETAPPFDSVNHMVSTVPAVFDNFNRRVQDVCSALEEALI